MTNHAKIRWGILATGGIAGAFARALDVLPDAELVAVGSRSQATADTFGDHHNIPHRHGSYDALIADPDVDVIYIATPHAFHAENAIACLQAGKAVLCEKAFTINAHEATEVIRVAREENRFLMEAMYTRHLPMIRQVKTWVDEGRIGAVRMVQANRCSSGTYDPSGRHMNLDLGGGSLLDVGIYPLSFAAMLLGSQPETAMGVAHLGETGADEQGAMTLRYSNGAVADLAFALHTKNIDDARVLGTKGMIYVHPAFWRASRATLCVEGEEDVTVELPVESNGLNYEAAEVMRCLREGLTESPVMPLDDTLHLMQVMDELRAEWGLHYPNDRP